jgi:hypothetical protein
MSNFYKCEAPYPQVAKVWNNREKEWFITVVIANGLTGDRILDHNGNFWDNMIPLDDLDLLNPIKLLENNPLYDYLTKEPPCKP